MQPKFTLNRTGGFFRTTRLLLVLCSFLTGSVFAQTFTNGVLSTGATSISGVAAPAGKTWSECQNVPGDLTVANTNAGAAAGIAGGFSVADDFTIPAGPSWNLTKIRVYAYSTGAADGTSPFTDMRVRIHNSSPLAGPTTIAFGDLTTNRLSSSFNSNVLRIFNTVVAPATPPNATRIIWVLEANVNVTLAPGTYWLEYQTGTALASNFTPSSSPVGVRTLPGYNAIQSNAGAWAALTDPGQGPNASPVPVDMPFSIDYTTGACAGTPAPGNTIASVTTACAGINFNLSLQNPTNGGGVSYQWQSSPDGTTWTNIAGATGSTLARNQTASTFYRAIVTCSAGPSSGTSTPVQVLLTPAANCYCIPPATDCSDNDIIANVQIGTLNNPTACGNAAGYSDFTQTVPVTDVIAGAANPMTVTGGVPFSKAVGVWIDYNKNGQFEANEFNALGSALGGVATVSGNVVIPAGAPLGQTRMRVRLRFGTAAFTAAQACTNPSAFGETEDYTVNIVPCIEARITTPPASASVACGGNASFTAVATGTFPTWTWQQRVNSSAVWTTVTNGGMFSGATTATLTLTNVPASMSGYQYRALMTGACSAVDFSTPATLTVTPIVATVSPASATICTGSIQQLTLTNASSPATVTFNSTGSFAIPDASAAGVLNTIVVSGIPAGAIVSNISVRLNISHTFVGDLDINVIAPNNVNMNLVGGLDAGSGSNGTDDFINTVLSSTSTNVISGAAAPRTGTFAAERRLGYGPTGNTQTAAVNWTDLATTLNGNWRLAIADFFTLDAGTVNSWSVSITYGAAATGVWTASPAAPNTMFTDAAATVPYVAGSQATSIYVKPAVNTNYSVVYSTPTPCVSNPTVIPVTVANPVTGLAVAAQTACVGTNATFTATTTGGNPLTYQWQVSTDGGTTYTDIAGATASTYTATAVAVTTPARRFRVRATAAPCAGSVTSAGVILTVNAAPVVTLAAPVSSLTPGVNTTITATSNPAAASYTWTYNGSPLAGATTNAVGVTVDNLGTYQARVVDVNGCVGLSNELTIGGDASDRLWIYPNPTNGAFQVRLFSNGSPTERREVTIYDINGKRITSKVFTLDNFNGPYLRMDFDLSSQGKGTYVVKVVDRFLGKSTSGLVVVQ